jgi:hypothetical protein
MTSAGKPGANPPKGAGASTSETGTGGGRPRSADRTEVVGQNRAMSPGDQVPPGSPGAGENICPTCGGRGRLQGGATCTTCDGTGVVIEAVGGGG